MFTLSWLINSPLFFHVIFSLNHTWHCFREAELLQSLPFRAGIRELRSACLSLSEANWLLPKDRMGLGRSYWQPWRKNRGPSSLWVMGTRGSEPQQRATFSYCQTCPRAVHMRKSLWLFLIVDGYT